MYTTETTTVSQWAFTIDGTVVASGWGVEPNGRTGPDRVADGTYSLYLRSSTRGPLVDNRQVGYFLVNPIADSTGRKMTNVLIHSGNSYKDTQGCYIPGWSIDHATNSIAAGTSRPAVQRIYELFMDPRVRSRAIEIDSPD
jgi:hypothetical protein